MYGLFWIMRKIFVFQDALLLLYYFHVFFLFLKLINFDLICPETWIIGSAKCYTMWSVVDRNVEGTRPI